MPRHEIIFTGLLFLFLCQPAPAQDIHAFDEKIDRFIATRQRDSMLYYTELKASRCRTGNNLTLWAWVYLDAHDLLSDMGDDPAARTYLDKISREKWREPSGKEESEPFCYVAVNQALAFLESGQMLQAIERYEWAEKTCTLFQYPDFDVVETIYKPLGNCYTRLGDDDKALAVFMKAMQIGGDNETLAGLYCNIGIALWNKGALRESENYHRQGLALTGVSARKRALLLGALAQTLLDEHRNQEACANARRSLALLAGIPESDLRREYRCYSLLTVAITTDHPKEARRLLEEARQEARVVFGNHSRVLGKIEISLAEWQYESRNYPGAMETANRALSAVLPRFLPKNTAENPDITQFYEENVISQALRLKAAAAAGIYATQGGISNLQLASDCHELAWQAEALLRKTYQYNSSKLVQQSGSWDNEQAAMRIIRRLYEKTGDRKYANQAFDIAERNKAAVLRDALNDNLIARHLAGADERFQKLASLRQGFSYFERQLLLDPANRQAAQWRIEADALQTQIGQTEAQLKAAYPNLNQGETADTRALLRALKPGEAVLEYFVSTDTTDIFLFMPGPVLYWKTIPTPHDQIAAYTAFFNDQNAILSDPAGFLNLAWQLWLQLIPAEARQAQQLLVIPDGALNNIPFDALLTEAPNAGASLRNAAYLIRKQEVRYAWSLAALATQQKLVSAATGHALVLAPRFLHGEQGMSPLDFNSEESPADSKLLEGPNATRQTLSEQASRYHILHLATHAFAGDERGARLVLFDGEVFLPDIYGLSLQADLVMLSACETSLGKRVEGEGVMSFARAFAQAGAACVVSSQWSVNDRSTARLSATFYRETARGKSIGTALRQAKLDYLNDAQVAASAQTPYFWAGLAMIGDDRNLPRSGGHFWWWAGVLLPGLLLLFWLRRKRNAR